MTPVCGEGERLAALAALWHAAKIGPVADSGIKPMPFVPKSQFRGRAKLPITSRIEEFQQRIPYTRDPV